MLIGNVTTWRGAKMIRGWSGDTNVGHEYARQLSADPRLRDLEVQWTCTNGSPRDVRTYVNGRQVRPSEEG